MKKRPIAPTSFTLPARLTSNNEFDQALVRLAGYHRCTIDGGFSETPAHHA